jgi:predicted S18 family serine protease
MKPRQSRLYKAIALLTLLLTVTLTSCNRSSSRNDEITVDVLWFKLGDSPKGGSSPLVIEVSENSTGKMSLSLPENQPGSAGELLKSSAWMAALNASLLLGQDLSEYDFRITVDDPIDGPSAGAMMTIAFLSLLRGDEINPDVAMTGGINPDGTISPVGGIPEKLDGAQEAGKTLVLVPLGQLSGDVLEKQRKLDLEVREVSDIYEAYEIATGNPLPKPEGSDNPMPSFSESDSQKIKAKTKDWQSRYQAKFTEGAGIELPQNDVIQNVIMSSVKSAKEAFNKSENYLEQGEVAGSYSQMVEATAHITFAVELARFFKTLEEGSFKAAKTQLDSALESADNRIEGLIDRLSTIEPKSASDTVSVTLAYTHIAVAEGLLNEMKRRASDASSPDEILGYAALVMIAAAQSNMKIDYANDVLDLGIGGGDSVSISEEDLEGFAQILENAAKNNLNYFENYLLSDVAQEAGVRIEEVKYKFAQKDKDYSFAISSLRGLPELEERVSDAGQKHYAKLGASMGSYYFSSMLIGKYISLGAKLDEDREIIGFTRERSLIKILDFTEKRTRELIALASTTGNDPILLIMNYDAAKLAREGEPKDKVAALGELWNTGLAAELMAIFSGQFKLP